MSGEQTDSMRGRVGSMTKQISKEQQAATAIVKDALSSKIGQEWADRLAPVLAMLFAFFKVVAPFIVTGFKLAKKSYDELPIEIAQATFGFALCFFGGVFQASIAAVEAFKLFGWDKTRRHLQAIYSQVQNVIKHQGDAKKQMASMSADELLMFQGGLVLKHVEPEVIQSAWKGLFQAWMGVVASLQSQFAKTVTLGSAIAGTMQKSARTHVTPVLAHMVPAEHTKWIPFIVDSLCKAIAVSVAWFLARVISAVHAAIRGGSIFVHNAIKIAKKHGMLEDFDEDQSNLDEIAGWALALVGFYAQLKGGFTLSFPLNILLLPLTMLETLLVWAVGTGSV
eukprot:g2281.t1